MRNCINKNEKIVTFAGHRNPWHCIGIENKLPTLLEELINKGYTIFYNGGMGEFDKKCEYALARLKKKYEHIKIYKIINTYSQKKEKMQLPNYYEGSILPDIEELFFKQKIIKKNEWMVESCDLLICHIEEDYKSGAYRTVKYARKINKPIIYI